ncbi:MAG TPA: hypothetical protein VMJ31_07480 [Methylocystis sp.]|nr:hypothetical protein [Methylocystis sp.]
MDLDGGTSGEAYWRDVCATPTAQVDDGAGACAFCGEGGNLLWEAAREG